jgi:UDP-GlcNAc3NAcA epimerase
MPEEQNRILTDHLSEYLFCPTETAVNNLAKEGLTGGVSLVGDIMLDASLFYQQKLQNEKKQGIHRLKNIAALSAPVLQNEFILATVHRAENTDNPEKLKNIIDAFNALENNIILPLHPRTRKILAEKGFKLLPHIHVIEPVGYFEMLELEKQCRCIVTDSGGIQKEAYFMKKPCFTLRGQTEWVETVESGWNILVETNKQKITEAIASFKYPAIYPDFYGSGDAGNQILNILENKTVTGKQ